MVADVQQPKDTSKLAEKVRRLLALASSPNPFEAAQAAKKAAELIEKFALDVEAIKAGEQQEIFVRMDWKIAPVILSEWKLWGSQLLMMVGSNNFTYPLQDLRRYDKLPRYTLVGKSSIVEAVDYLFVYLCRAVSEGIAASWSAQPAEFKSKGAKHDTNVYHRERYIWRRNFAAAAIKEINTRLRENSLSRSADTQALVVVADAELSAAVKQFFPVVTTSKAARGTNLISAAARAAGAEFGQNVRISLGVGDTGERRKQLR